MQERMPPLRQVENKTKVVCRISLETSFVSKQPKLELKLVLVLSGCFTSKPKQRVSVFRLNRNKQKTNPSSFIESIFWDFSENFGLFQFVSKQFCLFQLFRYRFETPKQPKQTKIFVFGFTKQSKTQPKQIYLVSVCLGSNWNFFCLF